MIMQYVVDTCIINMLIDGKFSVVDLPSDGSFYASHIQIDEINKTQDSERRAQLLLKFSEVSPEIIPTESGVWSRSRWGQAKFSDGVLLKNLKKSLDRLNNSKDNNMNDALIAETAVANSYTLLTSDKHLAEVVKKLDGKVIYFPCK
jgi:predicted nucleic acid-binding protein